MTQATLWATSDAVFSPCRTWRYTLTRTWDAALPVCNFLMLNPSTADETASDPTVTRCLGFARRWGYGTLIVTNIFAYRSTDPRGLLTTPDPVGPDNDAAIVDVAGRADRVIAAWGVHGALANRERAVLRLLKPVRWPLCLGRTKGGHPRHPLYVRADAVPVPLGRES